ncbi:hypothetical protein M378DRAFT_1055664, partial [Amanita muscaria Koide BX008]
RSTYSYRLIFRASNSTGSFGCRHGICDAICWPYHPRYLRNMLEARMAVPAKAVLDMCKEVDKRMWRSMVPLRQFKGVPAEVIRKAEGKQYPWE